MNFLEFLKNGRIILDGGMGSMLQKAGLQPGENTAEWNISHPDIVTRVHESYFNAGSNVVSTNTFGANILNFEKQKLHDIVEAAVRNAKKAAELSIGKQEKFIALDIGPTGKMLKPYGELEFEQAVSVFAETVRAGTGAGADLIFIETISDIYEAKAAILAAKENSTLPVMLSCSFDEKGKMLTGATPEVVCAVAESLGADAIGINCSLGPDKLMPVLKKMTAAACVPVIFKPNAGLPDEKGNYSVSPAAFADCMKIAAENGAALLGGCCGTTPEYIYETNNKVSGIPCIRQNKQRKTIASSYTGIIDFDNAPVIIGERINPTGKKFLKKALAENDIGYILNEANKQTKNGADCLDINTGAPGVDEKKMLPYVVSAVQEVSTLPLQIDSSDSAALAAAMRIYNGKPVINSVNGSNKSMAEIFPLIKKYGGLLIALTLDENGVPDTAEKRLEIAEKILKKATLYGINKEDIIFDPLTTTVATDPMAAKTTVEAVRLITEKLGCKTILGVSNVSFGLPERNTLNSAFLSMALFSGLSAAIINPCSPDMQKAVITYKALTGKDNNFTAFSGFAASNVTSVDIKSNEKTISLKDAVIKGFAAEAGLLTQELIKTTAPAEIINEQIIPALDETGKLYDSGIIFLPGLIASANAAKSSFEIIRSNAGKNEKISRADFVLATVRGDVHDIGKNIVKLILENYGFNVIDLGKDVAPEIIVNEVMRTKADFVGLSALMTTTLPAMEQSVSLLKEKTPWCKIITGGAVVTEEYSYEIGADHYGKDAMSTVNFALSISEK